MSNEDATRAAFAAVQTEVERVDARWGLDHDPLDGTWLAVLVEEVGEVGRCLNAPWPRMLSSAEKRQLDAELAQVAAVALRWMVRLRCREGG